MKGESGGGGLAIVLAVYMPLAFRLYRRKGGGVTGRRGTSPE